MPGAGQVLGDLVDHEGNPVRTAPRTVLRRVTERLAELGYHAEIGVEIEFKILAVGVEGNQEQQIFTVNYTDGTSSSFTQSLSDWAERGRFKGESVAAEMPYRLTAEGSKDANAFYAHAYSFALDSGKVAKSVSLPANANVLLLAATLAPSVK